MLWLRRVLGLVFSKNIIIGKLTILIFLFFSLKFYRFDQFWWSDKYQNFFLSNNLFYQKIGLTLKANKYLMANFLWAF